MKRIVPLGGILVAMLATAPGATAADGTGCSLNAAAKFSPGLTTGFGSYGMSFSGTLENCKSSASAPASGMISSGVPLARNGFTYLTPSASGSGSCQSGGAQQGVAFVSWADGTLTVIDYSTSNIGPAMSIAGTVRPSISLQLRDPDPHNPSHISDVISTTRFAGYGSPGAAVIAPGSPQGCAVGGVSQATFAGALGFYKSS